MPLFTGQTYGDLVLHVMELKENLEVCNKDKAALRGWAENAKGSGR